MASVGWITIECLRFSCLFNTKYAKQLREHNKTHTHTHTIRNDTGLPNKEQRMHYSKSTHTHIHIFDVCKWLANSNNSNRIETTIYAFVCKLKYTHIAHTHFLDLGFLCGFMDQPILSISFLSVHTIQNTTIQHIHLLRVFCVCFVFCVYNLTTWNDLFSISLKFNISI